jgi:hypothetical protein
MLPGRSGRSLSERAANSGARSGGAAAGGEPVPSEIASDLGATRPGHVPAGSGGDGRHCWVRDPPDAPGTWPGLLVEWRQRDGAWQGRVAYTVTGPHGPALVETWLPAARLEPR